tara:strand:- start:6018 stop:7520 length:1503 start_codon:yes stop_codon:yes gene_type:complete
MVISELKVFWNRRIMSKNIKLNALAHQHSKLLHEGAYSVVELVEETLQNLKKHELNAYITITESLALKQAEVADERIKSGKAGPLTGIPIAVKDLLSTVGNTTTAGSKILSDYQPLFDCTVVERLQDAGAVIVAKTNLDEFAMGSSNEHSAFGSVINPWDPQKVPGGSSGGSAVAVANRDVSISLGTDTGGSIRQPAAFCGVTGLKPTYGRVSRYGVIAFGSSLEQVGPFGRDAIDIANTLQIIAGLDVRDSTTANIPVPDYKVDFDKGLSGLRVGVPVEFFQDGLDKDVRLAVDNAIEIFEQEGAIVDKSVQLPTSPASLPVYYIIAPSEASANLARYDGVKYGFSFLEGESVDEEMSLTRSLGFGPEVKRRIMLGTYALSAGYYDAYYLKAQKVRTLIRQEFEKAFQTYDLLLTPTTPTVAFGLGEKIEDPYSMYLNDLYTLPVNIAGNPAISLPCGFSGGLPIGLQLIAKPFDEKTLLRATYAYQSLTNWHIHEPEN